MPAIGSRLRRSRRQAPAGVQYAVTPKVEQNRHGILDHPLSRMMTSVQDAAPARGGAKWVDPHGEEALSWQRTCAVRCAVSTMGTMGASFETRPRGHSSRVSANALIRG